MFSVLYPPNNTHLNSVECMVDYQNCCMLYCIDLRLVLSVFFLAASASLHVIVLVIFCVVCVLFGRCLVVSASATRVLKSTDPTAKLLHT